MHQSILLSMLFPATSGDVLTCLLGDLLVYTAGYTVQIALLPVWLPSMKSWLLGGFGFHCIFPHRYTHREQCEQSYFLGPMRDTCVFLDFDCFYQWHLTLGLHGKRQQELLHGPI